MLRKKEVILRFLHHCDVEEPRGWQGDARLSPPSRPRFPMEHKYLGVNVAVTHFCIGVK